MITHLALPITVATVEYISLGNLKHDDRVALFLMDYPESDAPEDIESW